VMLWFFHSGGWLDPCAFSIAPGIPEPMDKRLRALVAGVNTPALSLAARQDHLALLAKWYFSSWRDGEWVVIDRWDSIPYRRLVNAISRVSTAGKRQGSQAGELPQ